jgi:uncharacterized protein involved in outer membrane biogenesis
MPLWKKLFYGFILTNLFAMALVTFVLPDIIRGKAVEWMAGNTARTLSITAIHLNPLNWQTSIEGLVLTESGSDRPFIAFKQLSFHVSPRSILQWAPVITDLTLDSPEVSVVRLLDGSFNYADLMNSTKPSSEDQPAVQSSSPRFALNNLVIHDGQFIFTDHSKPEVIHTIQDFELALPFIGNTSALANRFVEPHLSMRIDDAPIVATGGVKPFAKSLETSLDLSFNNIDLSFYAAYLPDIRRFKIESGHLSLDLKLAYQIDETEVPELILNGSTAISALRVRDQRDRDLFFLPLVKVDLNRASLFTNEIAISAIDVYGLELFVDRGQDGVWNHTRLANDPMFQSTSENQPVEAQAETTSPPKLMIESLRLRDGKIHFLDQGVKRPFKKELHTLNFDLNNITLESGNLSPFQLSLLTGEGDSQGRGELQVAGEVSLQPFALNAHLKTQRLPLAGTESYLPNTLSAYFSSGHVDSELDLQMSIGDDAPVISLNGEVGVRALRLREPVLQSDILAWESLQLSGLQIELAAGPPRVHLSEVVLNHYLAKVLVTKDGQVNLQNAVNAAESKEEVAQPLVSEPGGPQAATPSDSDTKPLISIETIVLQDGTFSFFDEHMKRPFRSELTRLGGRISGLDSVSGIPAEIDLRGNLNNVSPLKITGKINPFGEGLFADFKVRFDAIDLTQTTPYSGTYLGYTVEKGKLYLNLDYKIDQAQLAADNRVFLDQFSFGDAVQSDKATSLPVKLAIALLKDRKGEIKLDLPVSGSLDDPQFSIVGVTFTIIKNLLIKAVTSPFALLSSLVGGDEDFSAVYFEPGSAELSQTEQHKLTKLVEALQERPGLKVEVSGYVDAEKDPEGYRKRTLEQKIQQAAGKSAGAILSDQARSRGLKKVYGQADFPKPRNSFGLVKSLPDDEMVKLILANTPAGEEVMQELAEQRAKQVFDNLIQVQGFSPERLFMKRDDIFKKGDAELSQKARVGFAVVVD